MCNELNTKITERSICEAFVFSILQYNERIYMRAVSSPLLTNHLIFDNIYHIQERSKEQIKTKGEVLPFFFFKFWHVCVSHTVVSNSITLWTVACQAPLSMKFSRQEYWVASSHSIFRHMRRKKNLLV